MNSFSRRQLFGNKFYRFFNIRRYVMEGERIIPGVSTIHFDEISRKRIFAAIDAANFKINSIAFSSSLDNRTL